MSRTAAIGPTRMRLAFYGRTNHTGEEAGLDVARQYRACCAAAEELGAMTQWFYDAPHVVDGSVRLHVRDVESGLGAPRGDCRGLAVRLADPDRGFDMVICAALDRLPRQPRLRQLLLRAASTANVLFAFADDDLSFNRQLAGRAGIFSRLGLSCAESEWPALP